jgi:hypothetical protein
MLSNQTRDVLRMMLGEIDPSDAYEDLALAADALSLLYQRDAVVDAYNISCAFLNAQSDTQH